jgi:hypothetical protein
MLRPIPRVASEVRIRTWIVLMMAIVSLWIAPHVR